MPKQGSLTRKFLLVFLTVVCLSWATVLKAADARPNLTPLRDEVETLVKKYYPKADVWLDDDKIGFTFNTRRFMIHERRPNGQWQDAYEDTGPQDGGIVGKLSLMPGEYLGMASLPQTFDKLYYKLRITVPYSEKLDCHLETRLKYPPDVSAEFLKEFEALMASFEKHVTPAK